jgi:hypothetical protein
MIEKELSSYLPINKEIEETLISYFIRNQKETHRTKEKYLFDSLCKTLYESIKEINEFDLICNVGILFDFAKKKNKDVEKSEIQRIFDSYTNFDNIKYLFTKLKDFYIENEILKKVEIIAAKTLDKGILDKEGIKELSQLLESDIVNLGDNEGLLDTKVITNRYRKEQENRQLGARKRSLGYKELDALVTRPGAPEEMTILVGMKGSGKSAFKLCQENNLINSGICVVSFNPEMPLVSNMDRLVSIRSGLNIFELLKKDKDKQLQNTIERELRRIEAIPNFLYFEEATLDLYVVRDLIRKAKQIFSDKKVLPDDEYIFVTFDTFDMLEDFEDAEPKRIKANMNKFHRLIMRKEKIHSELLLQANENKIRMGKMFKKPEDLDYYKIGKEDIEGGAAFAAKARLVISINRPVQMKKEFFPERMEEWNMEMDLLNISGVKQNDGPLFFTQFSFNENMRIYSHKIEKNQKNDENEIK